ncbi:MAG: hypothetical protein IIX01_04960, partial [Clostridia bacterium]|nr:hypothetical protein [Clostridia bacterium]
LEDFFVNLKSGEEQNGNFLEEYLFLSQDEKRFVSDYLSMLGRGDSASQKAYFQSQKNFLNQYKTKSVEECKKYGDLYVKLGFLLGLAILVLIV